jgi:hypothetical protein
MSRIVTKPGRPTRKPVPSWALLVLWLTLFTVSLFAGVYRIRETHLQDVYSTLSSSLGMSYRTFTLLILVADLVLVILTHYLVVLPRAQSRWIKVAFVALISLTALLLLIEALMVRGYGVLVW